MAKAPTAEKSPVVPPAPTATEITRAELPASISSEPACVAPPSFTVASATDASTWSSMPPYTADNPKLAEPLPPCTLPASVITLAPGLDGDAVLAAWKVGLLLPWLALPLPPSVPDSVGSADAVKSKGSV